MAGVPLPPLDFRAMLLDRNYMELPDPDSMASFVTKLIKEDRAQEAVSYACDIARQIGPSFFEANALAAITLAKAGSQEVALEYWDRIIRSAPQKIEWLQSAISLARQIEGKKAQEFLERWESLLTNLYITVPSITTLMNMQQRGWQGIGAIGIFAGSLKGWLWLKKGEKPQLSLENGQRISLNFKLEPLGETESHILYRFECKLADCDTAYKISIADARGKQANGSPVICSPAKLIRQKKEKESITIFIPVYGDYIATMSCLGSVFASLKKNRRKAIILVAWDRGPDQKLHKALVRLAQRKKIKLIENRINMGFLGSVNNGLAQITDGDVVLLNADTIVHGDWIDRLCKAGMKKDAASITALGNEAELMSYPSYTDRGKVESLRETRLLDNAAATIPDDNAMLQIPVGVGFCMLMTRRALNKIGGFDGQKIFRGYSEEVDWCLRAEKAGFKNYGLFNLFVAHKGEKSFGLQKKALAAQNNEAIFAEFPKYRREYEIFLADDKAVKLREMIGSALVKNAEMLKTLEIRPWEDRNAPPWIKDEVHKGDAIKGAALFYNGSGLARLRMHTNLPMPDFNFTLPQDGARLRGILQACKFTEYASYLDEGALEEICQYSGLEVTKFRKIPHELFRISKKISGSAISPPPTSIAGWKSLKAFANSNPRTLIYVSQLDHLWAGVPKPENLRPLPLMKDYAPLKAEWFLLPDAPHRWNDWRDWLITHNAANLKPIRIN